MLLIFQSRYNLKFYFKLYLILAFTFFTSFELANAQYLIKGKVTDAESGEAMPFVNVFVKNTEVGATTDFDGFYSFRTSTKPDSVIASYIGYITKAKEIKTVGANQTILLNFQLKPDVQTLKEVVFVAGENPAYEIIRRVDINRKRNDKRTLRAFEYESYSKTEIDINNIKKDVGNSKLFKKLSSVIHNIDSIAGEDGNPVVPIFMSETISRYYERINPRATKEIVYKTNVKGVGFDKDSDVISQVLGTTFQQYNFYYNWMTIVDKEFISPLATSFKLYYEYSLIDSMMVDNDYCYKIDFWPRRAQDLAFNGTIWITKKEYALKQIDAKVNKETNLNWIKRIKIQQTYNKTKETQWLPKKTRVVVDFDDLGKSIPSLVGKFYISTRDWIVDKPKNEGFFNKGIELDQKALVFDDQFWIDNRHTPLSKDETVVLQVIDSLNNIPIIKNYSAAIKFLATGYFKVGVIDVGPYVNMIANNTVEGWRFGAGFRTNESFSKHWILKGRIGYGLMDDRLKYLVGTEYLFNRTKWTRMGFEFQDDVSQIHLVNSDLDDGGLFFAFARNGLLRKPFYAIKRRFYFESDLARGINYRIGYKQQDFEPLFDFKYFNGEKEPTLTSGPITTSEVAIKLRFAHNENFIENENRRTSLGTTSRWPILEVEYARGLKGVLGGDFDYNKLNVTLNKRFKLGFFGVSKVKIGGGIIFEDLPYPLLNAHIGNNSPIYVRFAYNLMNNFEFVSDQYVSLRYQHQFEGFILNRIPLIKKLKWRLVANANLVYGGLRKSNRKLIQLEGSPGEEVFPFSTLEEKPYLELGYGVENIFRFFRIDFFHRLSYRNINNANNFGVKFKFQVIL